MANDEEIIIPIKVTTEDAQRSLDDLADTASSAFDKVSKSAAESNDDKTSDTTTSDASVEASPGGLLRELLNAISRIGSNETEGDKAAPGGSSDTSGEKLKGVGDTAKEVFKAVKDGTDELSSEGGKAGSFFSSFSTGAEGGRSAAERFREAIHVMHPVLEEAGVSLGNLGAFARVAGAGFTALAAAVGGSLLVALAKLSDESTKTKERLDLLSGAGKGGGASQFENVKKIAEELGTTAADIAPAVESLYKGQQDARASDRNVIHPPNFVAGSNEDAANQVQVFRGSNATPSTGLSSETINTALKAFVEAGRLDQTSVKDSIAALKDLYESTKDKQGTIGKGPLTVDALDKLSPSLADATAKALSGSGAGGTGQDFTQGRPDLRAFLQRGGQVTGDQLLTGLARTEPGLRQQAEAIPPGVAQSLEHFEAAAKKAAEALSGDFGIANAIEKFAKTIESAAKSIDKFFHPKDYEPGGKKSDQSGPAVPVPTAPKSLGEVFSSNQGDLIGRLVSYLRNSGGNEQQTNPFGSATNFLTKATVDPGTLTEKPRPETPPPAAVNPSDYTKTPDGLYIKKNETPPTGAASPEKFEYIPPPPQQKFEYIPPPPSPQTQQQPGQQLGQLQPQQQPQPQPQQVADLGGQFQQLLQAITAAVSKPPPQQPQEPGSLGIRGSNDGQATSQIAALGAAAADAAEKLRGVDKPVETETAHAAAGGHITGSGTSTSDSIPARLSDGEFVLKAEAVRREGVDTLDAVNRGEQHFDSGGSVTKKGPDGRPDDEEHGVIQASDGNYYPYNSKAEKEQILREIEESNKSQPQKHRGHKSLFVGSYDPDDQANYQSEVDGGSNFGRFSTFNGGGLVSLMQYFDDGGHVRGPGTSTSDSIPARLSDGEYVLKAEAVRREGVEHLNKVNNGTASFADGGFADLARHFAGGGLSSGIGEMMHNSSSNHSFHSSVLNRFNTIGLGSQIARATAPIVGFASGGAVGSAPGPKSSEMDHWGTIDMRTDHGSVKVATERETMNHLSASAQRAKRFSTGSKPKWYGGGQ